MIEAYLAGSTPVRDWFAGPWRSREDRAAHARAILERGRWDRPALLAVLEAALAERGAPAAAVTNARRLGEDDCVAVASGQQPAVGGGPLLCLVKAAHSIAQAEELAAAGIPAVPVFWCASEDHDLGEAGHADLVHRDGRIERVHGELPHHGASLRHQPAAAWWPVLTRALEGLDAALGAGWWRRHQPERDEPLGRWTARVLEDAFADHGLVVVEAHHLRGLWTDAVRRACEGWPADAIAARNAELAAAGIDRPLGELDAPPLFRDTPRVRRGVAADEALTHLAEEPRQLSPGAGLRPVLQQLALPVACYCAGPGEIAYHAQLGPIYAALDAPPPVLLPRIGATLVPPWVRRGCDAWGLTPQQVLSRTPAVDDGRAAADHLAELDTALATVAARAEASPEADTARRLRTGLARLRRERDRLAASLERGRRRARQRPALGTLHAWLRPREGPQERSMSLAQALWSWGPGLTHRLVTACRRGEVGEHLVVELRPDETGGLG